MTWGLRVSFNPVSMTDWYFQQMTWHMRKHRAVRESNVTLLAY